MDTQLVITSLIFLPLIASALIYIISLFSQDYSKIIFYTVSILQIFVGIFIWSNFQIAHHQFQFEEKFLWLKKWNIYYSLGIDSFSIYLISLTIFLIPICVFVGLKFIQRSQSLFISLFLILESFVIGLFAAKDLFLFYIFFEAFLIPIYFIIGIWGDNNRIYASIKFFLYTLFGSILMLISIIYILTNEQTGDILELTKNLQNYPLQVQKILWTTFFISFAIKVPLWPFHTWLPDAHVEAPTSGSIILAGVLLKVGCYGLLRLNVSMFPQVSIVFSHYVISLSIIAVIYASIISLMQDNIKRMIAYSSIAHMGYSVVGIFTFQQIGIQGAIFQMISHALVSSGLFLCVGILYEQTNTKQISCYQGLAEKMPKFSILLTVFIMSSIALPMTSGFIGEFLIIVAALKVRILYGVLLLSGMILSSTYMLWLYIRIIFGQYNTSLQNLKDIKVGDTIILSLIAIAIIILGIYPKIVHDYTLNTVTELLNTINLSVGDK